MKERPHEQLDGKTYRRIFAASSKDHHDDLAARLGVTHELADAVKAHTSESGPVKDREPEQDPLLLRPVLALLTIVAVISGCAGVIAGLGGFLLLPAWAVFLVSAGPRLGYAYYKYRKEQKEWLARINRGK